MERVFMIMFKYGKKVAEQDVTLWTAEKVAVLADIQQEMLGREIYIKRLSE